MCGIIGYVGVRDATPILVEGLRKLEYRGYDSAGVAVSGDAADAPTVIRRPGKIAMLDEALQTSAIAGTCGIGHTRWATHGPPTENNAHPHRGGKVTVVHNGILENHAALRKDLGDVTMTSDTDTEVLAHVIDQAYEGDLHAAVRAATARAQGAWALCVMHDDHPGEIVVARHGSPLLIGLAGPGVGEDSPGPECFVASDVAAMLTHTKVVVDLEDGDTAVLDARGIRDLHGADGTSVRRRRRMIEWSPLAAQKGGFKHFMLKEIFEQPRAIRDTMMGRLVEEGDRLSVDLGELALPIYDRTRLWMLACGTSWHSATAAKYLIEGLARVPVNVEYAHEFRYADPIVRSDDIAVAISQSGETADTLAALREAQARGAKGLALCNVVDSTIARSADWQLYTQAGPEISVASTKAFTTQWTLLTLLAVHLGRTRDTLPVNRAQEILESLRTLPVVVDQLLEQHESFAAIARATMSAHDFLYLGRGLCFPAALEGALKLKEISYAHAEGYSAGEMKHGPIALIDEGVPVVVLALPGPAYDKTVANLEAVRSRGGTIIAVGSEGDEELPKLADHTILIPTLDPWVQPLAANVPLQLLAYYIADLRGTDVDQPRNLAKSVTVE